MDNFPTKSSVINASLIKHVTQWIKGLGQVFPDCSYNNI